ncbi:MAG: hypothetical protein B6245_10745 [Desulfobacteraceae bacterium 4572_88]|nr:MAG: hypothetical protein B6245_10745 [Desulfobacteraceae bacterium 4572_88]
MHRQKTRYLSFTDSGIRSENQDHFIARTFEDEALQGMNRGELFAVADGMGGHRAGREAALEVCNRLSDTYFRPDYVFDTEIFLETLFKEINLYLEKTGQENTDRLGWGCALSALVIREKTYVFAHAGDTRIYHFRRDGSQQITEDQNMAYQMYKSAETTYEEYLTGVGHNVLLSYMGQGKGISIETGNGKLEPGDIFMICSDGLNQFADSHHMEQVLMRRMPRDSRISDQLRYLYDTFTKDLICVEKARDNVTFVLIGVEHGSEHYF